jgi:hypothetical protein
MLDGVIKHAKYIEENVMNKNLSSRKPEAAQAVQSVVSAIIPVLEYINPLGHFYKDNEGFKSFLTSLEGVMKDIVGVLEKIVKMTCITKLCLLIKLLKKFEELKKEIEEKKSKTRLTRRIIRGRGRETEG